MFYFILNKKEGGLSVLDTTPFDINKSPQNTIEFDVEVKGADGITFPVIVNQQQKRGDDLQLNVVIPNFENEMFIVKTENGFPSGFIFSLKGDDFSKDAVFSYTKGKGQIYEYIKPHLYLQYNTNLGRVGKIINTYQLLSGNSKFTESEINRLKTHKCYQCNTFDELYGILSSMDLTDFDRFETKIKIMTNKKDE